MVARSSGAWRPQDNKIKAVYLLENTWLVNFWSPCQGQVKSFRRFDQASCKSYDLSLPPLVNTEQWRCIVQGSSLLFLEREAAQLWFRSHCNLTVCHSLLPDYSLARHRCTHQIQDTGSCLQCAKWNRSSLSSVSGIHQSDAFTQTVKRHYFHNWAHVIHVHHGRQPYCRSSRASEWCSLHFVSIFLCMFPRNVCCSQCCQGMLPWRWRLTSMLRRKTWCFIRSISRNTTMSGQSGHTVPHCCLSFSSIDVGFHFFLMVVSFMNDGVR